LIPRVTRLTLGEKVVRALLLVLAILGAAAVAWVLRFLILPIAGAMLMTYVLSPVADALENRGLKRSTAVMVCGGLVGGMMFAVLSGVWPSLESWMRERPQEEGVRSAFDLQLEHRFAEWQRALTAQYPGINWQASMGKALAFLQHQRQSLVEELPAMALSAASHLGAVGLAIIIAFFVLLDGSPMKRAVLEVVPNRHFENALLMLDRVDRQISAYLIGTASENVLVTVVMAIALYALGMPNALLFAVIFGVCNVIPFAGPFIGASAGLLFSLLDPSAPSLGALALVYVVVHLVDAMVISPMVMGRSLNMHPLTVIVGISVGGTLGGVLGMLVIIPMIAVAKAIALTIAEGVRNAATAEQEHHAHHGSR
jgi:predicted PurR-regulated permease PerM